MVTEQTYHLSTPKSGQIITESKNEIQNYQFLKQYMVIKVFHK